MSALAEALLAAQRDTLAATRRAYLAGIIDDADVLDTMNRIGCTDSVEQAQFVAALESLRAFGVQVLAPIAAGTTPKEDRPASEAQWKLLRRLAEERGTVAPEGPLTSAQASKAINELKAALRKNVPPQ